MENHISREAALELLRKYNKDPFHLRHALTVEAVMRWYAKELAGKAASNVIREDKLCGMLAEVIKG